MIKRPTIITVFVLAVLTAVYYCATPADRDRWLASLGLSKAAKERVRNSVLAEREAAARAQEEARYRGEVPGSPREDGGTSSAMLSPDEVCARFHEVQRLRRESGMEAITSKTELELEGSCGTH
jgi:hypothetical protein